MSEDRVYCSDRCHAAGEPLLGTAAQVDVWLLLEYRETWRSKAVADNDLRPAIGEWIAATVAAYAAAGRKARPQFIRRPESEVAGVSLFVGPDGRLLHRRLPNYQAIERLDVATADFDETSEQRYFVCTNGQRDLCCARYGLPTYSALRERVGARVWQTTHVGGHRFAPNVLALPQGALYGRVFADETPQFVDAVERGDLSLPHLRGRAAYPPQAQVAEARVRGARELQAVNGNEVIFNTRHGVRRVKVQRAATPFRVIASCGKTETEEIYPFR